MAIGKDSKAAVSHGTGGFCLFGASGKNGAGEGTRTPDPIITNDVLYQLSYSGGGVLLAGVFAAV